MTATKVQVAQQPAGTQVKQEDEKSMVPIYTLPGVQTIGLTQEILDALNAPVPPDQIKTIPGSKIRYTPDKFVIRRLNEVVGVAGWEDHYTVKYAPVYIPFLKRDGTVYKTVVGTVEGSLTVLGVTKSSTAPMEMTPDMYGTPDTNGQATVFKRCAMKLGIAEELWMDVDGSKPTVNQANGATSQTRSTKQPSGDGTPEEVYVVQGYTTPRMGKWLEDLGVPRAVAMGLELGEKVDGKYNGEASQMISALQAARTPNRDKYDADKLPYVRTALKKVAPHLLDRLDEDYMSDDEDPD